MNTDNTNENIFERIRTKELEHFEHHQKVLIIQPGAVGDCILTLPLAQFILDTLPVNSVDILGHLDYIDFYPQKTCIDQVKSLDSIDIHKFFVAPTDFHLDDHDPLISFFGQYDWIVSFLGERSDNFEQNLIFTAHCMKGTHIVTLAMKPPDDYKEHVSNFYIEQFCSEANLDGHPKTTLNRARTLIQASVSDRECGAKTLKQLGVDPQKRLVLIHPGSGGKAKTPSPTLFSETATRLSKNTQIAFLFGPSEEDRLTPDEKRDFDSTGPVIRNVSLAQIVQIMTAADALVGCDSGISHLAGAMGLQTLALFGPSNPNHYAPLGSNVEVLQMDFANNTQKIVQMLLNTMNKIT